jgi:hypothetical protein
MASKKIDFSLPVLDFKGNPIHYWTFKDVCVRVLLAQHFLLFKKDNNTEYFKLAMRIKEAKVPININAKEAQLINTLVDRSERVIIVGRVRDLLGKY